MKFPPLEINARSAPRKMASELGKQLNIEVLEKAIEHELERLGLNNMKLVGGDKLIASASKNDGAKLTLRLGPAVNVITEFYSHYYGVGFNATEHGVATKVQAEAVALHDTAVAGLERDVEARKKELAKLDKTSKLYQLGQRDLMNKDKQLGQAKKHIVRRRMSLAEFMVASAREFAVSEPGMSVTIGNLMLHTASAQHAKVHWDFTVILGPVKETKKPSEKKKGGKAKKKALKDAEKHSEAIEAHLPDLEHSNDDEEVENVIH